MNSRSDAFIKPVCPCKDCDRRTMTCHGVCIHYKSWKAYLERINEREQQNRRSKPDRGKIPFWEKKNRKDVLSKR